MTNVINKEIFFLKLQKYNNFFRVKASKIVENLHHTVSYGLLHRRLKKRIRSKALLNLNFNKESNHVDFNPTDR